MLPALSNELRRSTKQTLQGVRNIWTIMSKELSSFFSTSVGYTVILGYVLTTSIFFLYIVDHLRDAGSIPATNRPLTFFYSQGIILIVFIFLSAILSMRLFAREKETGTIEMLLTVPVGDWEVVMGKYLATIVYYLICISPSLVNSLVLFRPEFTLNLHHNILIPTLVILPLMLLVFSFVSPKQKIQVVVGLMCGAFLVIVLLRGLDFDSITQRSAFIPADQVDFDNDNLADTWEKQHDFDTSMDNQQEDPDHDGDNNLIEYIYGTDPRDRNDNVTARIIAIVPPKNELAPTDADIDNDGIPDKWERFLGLSSENSKDGQEDNDGDGIPNVLEWMYGTNHKDPQDTIRSKYLSALPVAADISSRYVDNDNDEMPDAWESSYNLSANEQNAGVDTDGDGYSNKEEYHYRTDPTDKLSIPRLPESRAWILHILSYVLAIALFMFLSFPYTLQQETRAALTLKYVGISGLGITAIILIVFLMVPIRSDNVYSGFLFWGFTLFFITITAILSRLCLLSRSKLNAAAAAMFLFLVFRIFWCFYIAEKAPSQPDVGITFSGITGGFITGAFFIAIGMFFSALFKNQIDAAVVTFASLIIILFSTALPYFIAALEDWKALFDHYNFQMFLVNCADGSIPTGRLTFMISSILLAIFMTVRVLGMRKWK